jgi:hypothetical protein
MLCVRGECFSIRKECWRFLVFSKIRKNFVFSEKLFFVFLYRCENSFFNFTFHFSFFIFRDSFFILHIVARIYDGLLQFLRMKKIPSSRHRRDRMWMEKSVLLTGHR